MQAEGPQACGHQQDLDSPALQARDVEERRLVLLALVLVLDLPLLVLQVENSSSLVNIGTLIKIKQYIFFF